MKYMVQSHVNSVSEEELKAVHPLVQVRRDFKKTFAGKLTMAPTPTQALIGCGTWAAVLIGLVWQASSFHPVSLVSFAIGGLVFWSIVEYIGHRTVFHGYHNLPVSDKTKHGFEALHVPHHYEEFDGINAGPMFFVPLGMLFMTFFLGLSRLTFQSYAPGQMVMVGFLFGFMAYEWFHFQLHLGKANFAYVRFLRSFHKLHHRKNWRVNFGITNPLWDMVWKTYRHPETYGAKKPLEHVIA